MPVLNDVCLEFQQVLEELEDKCIALSSGLREFDSHVSSYATGSLIRRLTTLGLWIGKQADLLYKKYNDQGYVCVLFSQNRGYYLHWAASEQASSFNKPWLNAQGITMFSIEEVLDTILQMTAELQSGNWAKVVDWLREYGRSPGLEFDKVSFAQLVDYVR